jgi:hypothetical protein
MDSLCLGACMIPPFQLGFPRTTVPAGYRQSWAKLWRLAKKYILYADCDPDGDILAQEQDFTVSC